MSAVSCDRMAMAVLVGFVLMIVGTEGCCSKMSGYGTNADGCTTRANQSDCTGITSMSDCTGRWSSNQACCWTVPGSTAACSSSTGSSTTPSGSSSPRRRRTSSTGSSTYSYGSSSPRRRRTVYSSCSWSNDSQNKYADSTGGAVISAIILGVIYIVIISLPLCCGVMKDKRQIVNAAACVIIFLGMFNCAIPLFGSMGGCAPIAKEICNSCDEGVECDQKNIEDACNALGFFFVYTFACGWIACVTGIVAASLGCCVCCGCFKMRADQTPVVMVGAVPQPVVGQPVSAEAVVVGQPK